MQTLHNIKGKGKDMFTPKCNEFLAKIISQ